MLGGGRGAGSSGTGAGGDAVQTEEELAAAREAELAAAAARLDLLNDELARLGEQHRLLVASVPGLAAALAAAGEKREVLERRFLVRRACMDMLPDAATHLERLAGEVAATASRLVALAEEWEGHRLPLVNAIHAALATTAASEAEAARLRDAIAVIRGTMGELAASMAAKEEAAAKMAAEWARLKEVIPGLAEETAGGAGGPGGAGGGDIATRPAYTRRIMDIVRQIRKQKAEIGRIVKDVRGVQAEINVVSDKLSRTVTVVSEAMDKAAADNAKDAAYRQVYRHLINLQELFQQLVAATTALGHAENDIRQLENRIDQLSARNDARNMDELLRDLAQVKSDNAALEAAAGGGGGGAAGRT